MEVHAAVQDAELCAPHNESGATTSGAPQTAWLWILPEGVEMMQRPMAVADLKRIGAGNRSSDIVFRLSDCVMQREAFGEAGRNCRGQRAARAVRVLGDNAFGR